MECTSLTIQGNIVDVVKREIFPGKIYVRDGYIERIERIDATFDSFILPGFIDAHVHIESSMVTPVEFSKTAIKHGTIGVISDPHEIANVLGIEGVQFMIENSKKTPLKILFGAPSCVPATPLETAGATINDQEIELLMMDDKIGYLSEVMNYPGVIHRDESIMKKISVAKKHGVPIDGHAPGLRGRELIKYAETGITTDHECFSIEEAREKILNGMLIQIREGSGAKNFNELIPLIKEFPERIMLCSDDLHPDDLLLGHINILVERGVSMGYDLFDMLRAASINAIQHYGLKMGMVQPGDPADFIMTDSLKSFNPTKVYIEGKEIYCGEQVLVSSVHSKPLNLFNAQKISQDDLRIFPEGKFVHVIRAIDGELVTRKELQPVSIKDGYAVSDIEKDILKITVVNRYKQAKPAMGFISGFGMKQGAIASSIAHDSHNIICVGVDDAHIQQAVNWIIDQKGGIVCTNGKEMVGLPLPVAGIITNTGVEEAANKYADATKFARQMGCDLNAPYMTLAFMALLVIPELKLSDKGLFDGNIFEFIPLFDR